MATLAQFETAVSRLNTATSAVGTRIDALVSKLGETGLSDAEETAALAQLSTLADVLEAMGKDPVNPVPMPVPTDPIV